MSLDAMLARLDANPRVGTCERCGDPFEDRSPAQRRRFCSDNCRKRHGDETTGRGVCIDCGGPMGARTKGRYLRCSVCHYAHENERTDARARQIVEWWAAGLTYPEICKRLGWTKGHLAVEMDRMRRKGHDLPLRPHGGYEHLVHFDVAEAAAKYRAGWTLDRVAESVGCSRETVRRRFHDHGVEIRRHGPMRQAA